MAISYEDFRRLAQEHRVLVRQYGRVQRRCTALIEAQAAQIRSLQAEIMRLRAAVIARDTALASERERHAELAATMPGLPRRKALARQVGVLMQRIETLMRERRRDVPQRALPDAAPEGARPKSVLCVGSDASSRSAAREMVERAGGRFLHHDEGEAADAEALEASLRAADLVICQTGCVSHNAIWRVRDHCRRTGKQCVLVGRPQALRFVRDALAETLAAGPDG